MSRIALSASLLVCAVACAKNPRIKEPSLDALRGVELVIAPDASNPLPVLLPGSKGNKLFAFTASAAPVEDITISGLFFRVSTDTPPLQPAFHRLTLTTGEENADRVEPTPFDEKSAFVEFDIIRPFKISKGTIVKIVLKGDVAKDAVPAAYSWELVGVIAHGNTLRLDSTGRVRGPLPMIGPPIRISMQ